jgi:hypothetical protein
MQCTLAEIVHKYENNIAILAGVTRETQAFEATQASKFSALFEIYYPC